MAARTSPLRTASPEGGKGARMEVLDMRTRPCGSFKKPRTSLKIHQMALSKDILIIYIRDCRGSSPRARFSNVSPNRIEV